jgi:anti-anti-sigma regulatory factor
VRVSLGGNLIVEAVARGVRVARFARPDLREYLYDDADMAQCPLFREVRDAALAGLGEGWTLVLNLGLVEPFPAALYRCLLLVRQTVLAHSARLVLCGLSEEHRELFGLLEASRVFSIVSTEAEALRAAQARGAGPERPLQGSPSPAGEKKSGRPRLRV